MSRLARCAFVFAAGCGASTPVRSPGVPGERFAATGLTAPSGTSLVDACTPTGAELCFNAIDDNCNGVIDEGCGLQTGLLQFTIAWTAATADVNLSVVTPEGNRVPGEPPGGTANGFHLDRDCPGPEGCGGQNTENVYYDGPDPPRGHYVVDVTLGDLHGATAPVNVRFGARLGPRVVGFGVDLSPGDDAKKTFSFDLR